ncbi:MAG TPA: valine--tRNA ligase [Candidatus Saccharimonadales bacterium]
MKLAKTYEPQQYEEEIYALWESSGAFRPSESRTGEHYSIVMPPPNANGNLHIGHALTIGLEDILTRYHRMKGDATVYIPGADHAGLETWVVYEKLLEREGKSRFDFSREELYSQVWDFVEKNRGNMELQVRQLGASCSWEHLVFTLDAPVIKTAYETFKKMWDDDLIYRGERIVNYCTKHQTSFADIEVEHKNEKGKLWRIGYELTDGSGEIIVATTRPETLLGDTAIAVHPDDERYKEVIGKKVYVPIVNREVPIIADEAIDKEFGSGAVKVTPAHDPTDFEIGERHNLERISVISMNGTMNEHAPAQFRDLSVADARERVVAALIAADALRGEDDYTHAVSVCYKCGTVIEPLLMEQWFVRVKPLAKKVIEALKQKKITFYPATKAKELLQYVEQLRDWNISRQPVWGIPIPAFQNTEDENDWIYDTRVDQKTIEVNGKTYRREEDTFDTWFSSGQWPYIVTEHAHEGALKAFYPTTMMETGSDLLRAWVTRMLLFGLYKTGEVPFKQVYMHGMVLDEKGQKMSKSKGNVINPQEAIQEFGSDALRLGLIASRSAGQNQAFSTSKVVAGRNFCNKLWNIANYVEGRVGEPYKPLENGAPIAQSLADHWVVRQLSNAVSEIASLLESHRFAEAAELAYHTIWDDVADWYIEASKQQDNVDMLAWVLETSLKLAHPFAPFVSETIWQTLGWQKNLLIQAAWPEPAEYNEIAAAEFEQLQALITEIRYVSSELEKGKLNLLFEHDSLIADNQTLIAWLARLKGVSETVQPKGLRLAVPHREAWLEIDEDTLYEHQSRLETRLAEVREHIQTLTRRLDNPRYVEQAPEHIVHESREALEAQRQLENRLQNELNVLK